MKTTTTLLIAATAMLGTSAAWAADAGNVENGKAVYMSDGCWECHTTTGMGAGTGPKLAPNPIPVEGIVAELRHPRQTMPQYSEKVISDQEIADIHAYLASIPEGPQAKDIPALNH